MREKLGEMSIAEALHANGGWCCDEFHECEEIVKFVKKMVVQDAVNAVMRWEKGDGPPFSKAMVIELIRKSGDGT